MVALIDEPVRATVALKPTNDDLNFTDMGNAKRLVRWYGHKVKYVHLWGSWLLWDGTRWQRDETGGIYRVAKQTVARMYREAGELETEKERTKYVRWALNSEARTRLEAMISLARSEKGVSITPDQLDSFPNMLNCLNGTIDLMTGQLYEHNPDWLLTKRINVNYDPQATCPTWLKFLDRVMCGDKELIEFLARAIGYTLTGEVNEQCLFFMIGVGKNGKSTFIETLIALLGEYMAKTPTESLMAKDRSAVSNDIARLAGKRLVVARETEEGQRLAEATVKDLTGNDTVVARFLHHEFFEFRPSHKLWMYGNHKPTVRGTDEGIWRRLKIIPFSAMITAEERDPNLQDKLQRELSGILAWAVQGGLRWRQSGLTEPKIIRAATAEYRSEMDVLGVFISECCKVDSETWTDATGLYSVYTNWCDDAGERAMSKRQLGLRLKERGFASARTTGGLRIWKGLRPLKDDESEIPF